MTDKYPSRLADQWLNVVIANRLLLSVVRSEDFEVFLRARPRQDAL